MSHIVITSFTPFGMKGTNQSQEVAKRLGELREQGALGVPKEADVTFLSLDTTVDSVAQFVDKAKELKADKVLMLGENGLETTIEAVGNDRGAPLPIPLSALGISRHSSRGELPAKANVEKLADASGAKVSRDAGHFYCNYAYHTALSAGLNALFVHVPSGILGFGRNPEKAAEQVNAILSEWNLSDSSPAASKEPREP